MSESNASILVIDDEPPVRKFLRTILRSQRYDVLESGSGEHGMQAAAAGNPDLVLLDLILPDMDGTQVARRIRQWSSVPIIVISSRRGVQDKIDALDAGANDYLTKPFMAGELLARIRAALRRRYDQPGRDANESIMLGEVRVDLRRRQLSAKGQTIHLTPNEYKLLETFVKNPEKTFTHKQLLQEVFGTKIEHASHYLRVYISQLRKKIEPDPTRPVHLITEAGVGYRLEL